MKAILPHAKMKYGGLGVGEGRVKVKEQLHSFLTLFLNKGD